MKSLFKIKSLTDEAVDEAAAFYNEQGHSDDLIACAVCSSVAAWVFGSYGLRLGEDFRVDDEFRLRGQSGMAMHVQRSEHFENVIEWTSDRIAEWFVVHKPQSRFAIGAAADGQRIITTEAYEQAKASGQLLTGPEGETFRLTLPEGLGSIAVTRRPDGSFQYNAKDFAEVLKLGKGGEQ